MVFFQSFIDNKRIYGNVFHKLPAAEASGSGRGAGFATRRLRVDNSASMYNTDDRKRLPTEPHKLWKAGCSAPCTLCTNVKPPPGKELFRLPNIKLLQQKLSYAWLFFRRFRRFFRNIGRRSNVLRIYPLFLADILLF